ncbi:hypothetical protein LWI29_022207 [Acer saccharum]|uniref:Reverse transcriptase domain-containing protein n=1 Tax=Acer saccharum TaxID=4024 RepID=A0AA39W3E8_ACESA|nr:hypothetical protein LWI29_022207 [Acer saccharum]
MKNMGFGERWRMWMKSCVTTPMISILVNGSPTSQFGIGRGLRQGDPLSPFLYNIVSEGLSYLLRKAKNLGLLREVVFMDNEVHLTHLQFADDTIMFLKPCFEYISNARGFLDALRRCQASKLIFTSLAWFKWGETGCQILTGLRLSVARVLVFRFLTLVFLLVQDLDPLLFGRTW